MRVLLLSEKLIALPGMQTLPSSSNRRNFMLEPGMKIESPKREIRIACCSDFFFPCSAFPLCSAIPAGMVFSKPNLGKFVPLSKVFSVVKNGHRASSVIASDSEEDQVSPRKSSSNRRQALNYSSDNDDNQVHDKHREDPGDESNGFSVVAIKKRVAQMLSSDVEVDPVVRRPSKISKP